MDTKFAVYEVAAIEDPTEEEAKKGATPKLLVGPIAIVASSGESAIVGMMKQHAVKLPDDTGRVRVFVRPFGA